MTHLHITEAVPLGYALVARVAHDAGVRALCIKGPLTSELGLRPATHVSQDVDILVAPQDRLALEVALQRIGWLRVPDTRGALLVEPHSVQMQHDGLGVEVDLHDKFPGFFAAPGRVFEILWSRRRRWSIAGSTCWAVDPTASYLIELLHLARDPRARWPRLRRLTSSSHFDRQDMFSLARATGADKVVSQYFADFGAVAGPLNDDVAAWDRRVAIGRTRVAPALIELSTTSWHRRPVVMWRLIWLPRHEVLKQYPELAHRRWGASRARTRRWLRAARDLRKARAALKDAQASGSGVRP